MYLQQCKRRSCKIDTIVNRIRFPLDGGSAIAISTSMEAGRKLDIATWQCSNEHQCK